MTWICIMRIDTLRKVRLPRLIYPTFIIYVVQSLKTIDQSLLDLWLLQMFALYRWAIKMSEQILALDLVLMQILGSSKFQPRFIWDLYFYFQKFKVMWVSTGKARKVHTDAQEISEKRKFIGLNWVIQMLLLLYFASFDIVTG